MTSAAAPEPEANFEVVDHTADWAVRVRARDFRELLRTAAIAMNSLLVAAPDQLAKDVKRRLKLEAFDRESMLVEWLSELAYLAEAEALIFTQFDFHQVSVDMLDVTVRGGRVLELQKHIKAVTYHYLEVVETEDGLETTIVFDV